MNFASFMQCSYLLFPLVLDKEEQEIILFPTLQEEQFSLRTRPKNLLEQISRATVHYLMPSIKHASRGNKAIQRNATQCYNLNLLLVHKPYI